MSSWRATDRTLGEVCPFITDGKHGDCVDEAGSGYWFLSARNIVNGVIDYTSAREIRAQDFEETHRRTRLSAGDILLTNTGTIGRLAIAPCSALTERTTFQKSVAVLKPDARQVDSRYLFYTLSALQAELQAAAGGTTQQNLLLRDLRAFRVSLPPLSEQRIVAGVLGSLDDKIEHNHRTSRALEGLARATFKAWFVDFEPVKAKAAGATGFPGMLPDAFAAIPDRLTDSPLGLVPEGWAVRQNRELLAEGKERVGDLEVPAYSSTNEGLFPRDERFTKQLSKSQTKNMLIRRGDLVFGLSREILNFGVMYDEVGAVSPVYKVFRPSTSDLWPRYFELMIRERAGYYRQIVKSSSREGQSVSADHFLNLFITVPPPAIRDAFSAFETPARQMIAHLEVETTKLAALRDYLLPRLLSGEVRVGDLGATPELDAS